MKAHDWLVLFTVFGMFAFRGVMHPLVFHLWCRTCEVMTLLSARVVRPAELNDIELKVLECVALAEAVFPESEFTIIFHLLGHCPMFIRRWGPYSCFWMFPFERYVGFLSRAVTNRKFPAAMLTRFSRFLTLAEFYRPEINDLLGTTEAGAAYIDASTTRRPILGPELLSPRFHEDVVQLDGDDVAFTIPDVDMPFLRALFRLAHAPYDRVCKRYDDAKAAATAHAKAAKRALVFPAMPAWSPASGPALSERERSLLWGPARFVRRFPRAIVGGVRFRGGCAEQKLRSRGSFFCMDASPDGKKVVREYGRIHYFADVPFNGERIPVSVTPDRHLYFVSGRACGHLQSVERSRGRRGCQQLSGLLRRSAGDFV